MAARWDARQYLKFDRERTQACEDLLHRVELEAPRRVVDLGCGPGNSTALLARLWPGAELVGVDSSPEMLRTARASPTPVQWVEADLGRWSPDRPFDLVFSNAALQWVPDHRAAVPRIAGWVTPGGSLAFQVPARPSPPPRWTEIWRRLAPEFPGAAEPVDVSAAQVLPLEEYYRLLASRFDDLELWDTEYRHVLAGPEPVVEWLFGTALRPWLASLADDDARGRFRERFVEAIAQAYPRLPDGRVLFPFVRRFVVASGHRPG